VADVKSTVTELDEIRSRKSKKRADKNDQEKRADEAHAFTVQATFHRKRVNYFGRPFRTKDDFGINTTTISHYSQFSLDIFGDITFEINNLVHPDKLFIAGLPIYPYFGDPRLHDLPMRDAQSAITDETSNLTNGLSWGHIQNAEVLYSDGVNKPMAVFNLSERDRQVLTESAAYNAIVFSMFFSEEIQNFHSNTDGLDFNLVAQEPDDEEGRTTQTLSDFSIRSTQERCPYIYFWATIYSLGDP